MRSDLCMLTIICNSQLLKSHKQFPAYRTLISDVIMICTYTVNTTNFYDFGVSTGDAQLHTSSSPPIFLSTPFRFFGTPESILYVSQLYTLCIHTDMYHLHSNTCHQLQIMVLITLQAHARSGSSNWLFPPVSLSVSHQKY